MLRLPDRTPSDDAAAVLDALQALVDAGEDFPSRVDLAKHWWQRKAGTNARKRAFAEVRELLAEMSFGSVRCVYCEDSAADEIEHIAPKTVFPSNAFRWANYCFACGPCNGPKGNSYATVYPDGTRLESDPKALVTEPTGDPALIDPRREDPTDYLEPDIGGTAAGGLVLTATSEFLAREGLDPVSRARAEWTIDLLGLNREVVRKARETAYQSYRAALSEYAGAKSAGQSQNVLDALRDGILAMPHPTVLNEMIRQTPTQPIIQHVITAAPEIASWVR